MVLSTNMVIPISIKEKEKYQMNNASGILTHKVWLILRKGERERSASIMRYVFNILIRFSLFKKWVERRLGWVHMISTGITLIYHLKGHRVLYTKMSIWSCMDV